MIKEKLFLFSAWPYLSGDLHLGRIAGSFLPMDVYRNLFSFDKEKEIYTYSGVDCFGQKNIPDISKKTSSTLLLHKDIFMKLGIPLTHYCSTNHPSHEEYCKSRLLELELKGVIVEKEITYPFCEKCNQQVRSIIYSCSTCGTEAKEKIVFCNLCKKENSSYCKVCLSKLINRIDKRRIINTHHQLTMGRDSRKKQKFEEIERPLIFPGVSSPWNEEKKIWVWIEALLGYSRLRAGREGVSCFFYGKDNHYFHKNLLNKLEEKESLLYCSNFLLFRGEKMSGSKGNYLTLSDFEEEDHPFIRLYLCSLNLKKKDSVFHSSSFNLIKSWYLTKIKPHLISVNSWEVPLDYLSYLKTIFKKERNLFFLFKELQKKIKKIDSKSNLNEVILLLKIISPLLVSDKKIK
jgi:methionyl-tRNA synthetase